MTNVAQLRRDRMKEQQEELWNLRKETFAKYDLGRDLGLVKSGVYIAYLMDSTNLWDRIYDALSLRRMSQKSISRFHVAREMLTKQYHAAQRTIVEQMLAGVEKDVRLSQIDWPEEVTVADVDYGSEEADWL